MTGYDFVIIAGGIVAVLYGIIAGRWVLSKEAGNPRMQDLYNHVRAMLPKAQAAGVKILIGDDYSGVFREVLADDPLDHEVGNYGREFAYYGAIEGLSPAEVLSCSTGSCHRASWRRSRTACRSLAWR